MQSLHNLVLLQPLHASSTIFLVAFSPLPITAAQEALWYAVYAIFLWLLINLPTLVLAGGRRQQKRCWLASVYRQVLYLDIIPGHMSDMYRFWDTFGVPPRGSRQRSLSCDRIAGMKRL